MQEGTSLTVVGESVPESSSVMESVSIFRVTSPGEMVRRVIQGFRFDELEKLQHSLGMPLVELSEKLGIARATLHRRKTSGRLTSDESDKVMRFARLLQKAEAVFESADAAREWLNAPQRGLGGERPLDYAATEVGALEVDKLLGRIDYGVYA